MKTYRANWAGVSVWRIPIAFTVGLLLLAAPLLGQDAKPNRLRCESLVTPLGVDVERPRLSWQLHDARDGARQTAYQIQVASSVSLLSVKPDVWDSGKVASDRSQGISYAGPPL